ncbi:MAG: polysaccharide deacetylase family protein [Oscillospiraceae bacterium]|nr:polysaccharide deacetylase family protein [Oscillospiraceae bacterium]
MIKHFKKNVYKVLSLIFIFSIFYSNFNVFGITKEWGVSFQNPGEAPIIDEPEGFIEKYDGYYIGDLNEKSVYLTFDAGYENGYTVKILDILKKHGVPATFFLVGTYIRNNPEIIKRMINEGHIIGNHTMNHPDMAKFSSIEAFSKELTRVEDIYKSVTGEEMKKLYRPPCGKYNELSLKFAKKLGYKTIFWSVAYEDYEDKKQPSWGDAISKLTSRVHNGALILLHSTSKTNSLILDELIEKYKGMGFEFKSLEDLVK